MKMVVKIGLEMCVNVDVANDAKKKNTPVVALKQSVNEDRSCYKTQTSFFLFLNILSLFVMSSCHEDCRSRI